MKNKIAILFVLFSICFLFSSSTTDDEAEKKKAADDFKQNFVATQISSADELKWTGKLNQCKAGRIPNENYEKLLKRINYFRRLAGVSDNIYLDSVWNSYAQSAALIMYANNTLTHNPRPSLKCYSEKGKIGAETSNLGSIVDASIKNLVSDLIEDAGVSNNSCGHRKWLLNSDAVKMGVGVTPGAYAVRVFKTNDEKDTASFHGTAPDYYAYPFKGYVPYPVVYPKWSFYIPTGADFTNAKVTIKAGDKNIAAKVVHRANEYADHSLAWSVIGLKEDYEYNYYDMETKKKAFSEKGLLNQKITVTISDVKRDGKVVSYTYSFTIFDPNEVE
jgi:uncharacterized protein YkwD